MSDKKPRLYSGFLLNPVSDFDDIKTVQLLQEKGVLTQIFAEPSVTSISGAGGISWGFVHSAVSLTKEGKDYKKEWNDSAERGTKLHEVFEGLALGFDINEEDLTEPLEIQGFKWWKEKQPHPIKSEFLVWSRLHKFAGRADLYASIKCNMKRVKTLIDYKSIGKPEHIKKYPKAFPGNRWELVARAYAMGEQGEWPEALALVRISTEAHHTYFIPKEDWEPLMEAFLRRRADFDFEAGE